MHLSVCFFFFFEKSGLQEACNIANQDAKHQLRQALKNIFVGWGVRWGEDADCRKCSKKTAARTKSWTAGRQSQRQRLNGSISRVLQEDQEAKPQIRAKTHRQLQCWTRRLARARRRVEQNYGFVNYHTQHRASFPHQPAKAAQFVLIVEPAWIETISLTNGFQTRSSDSTPSWS